MRLERRLRGAGARRAGRAAQRTARARANSGRAPTVLVALVLLLVPGCARQWPAEPPEAHQWQLTTAPMNLVPMQEAGRVTTAFAYARQRPSPPSCDGLGADDCEEYRARFGRQLPARLDVTCWDEDDDGEDDDETEDPPGWSD